MNKKTPQQASRGGLAACAYSTHTNDPLVAFIAAMIEAGVGPHDPAEIVADGVMHRYRVTGDKPGTRNGYAVLHLDHVPAGYFGSWRHGVAEKWSAKGYHQMSDAERINQRRAIERAKQDAERLRVAKQTEAARRSVDIWKRAQPASAEHPYLVRKRISPGNARQSGDALVLPITASDGRLTSLQFIQPDGAKRLLSGGAKTGSFIVASECDHSSRVLICEGWATGRTLSASDPDALVLAAIDAGNLEAVATQARRRWSFLDLVIAGDDDRQTEGNPGRTKARAAAVAAGAGLIFPEWPNGAPLHLSDFNDLAVWLAGGAV